MSVGRVANVFIHRAMKQFIHMCPCHVGMKQDTGFSPLHLAAANDHPDILTALINYVSIAQRMHINSSSLHSCRLSLGV